MQFSVIAHAKLDYLGKRKIGRLWNPMGMYQNTDRNTDRVMYVKVQPFVVFYENFLL